MKESMSYVALATVGALFLYGAARVALAEFGREARRRRQVARRVDAFRRAGL